LETDVRTRDSEITDGGPALARVVVG
jgi:hypothetical protein